MAITAAHMKMSILLLGISLFLLVNNYRLPEFFYDSSLSKIKSKLEAVAIMLPVSMCCLVIAFITACWASFMPKKPSPKTLKIWTIFGCFLGCIVECSAVVIWKQGAQLIFFQEEGENMGTQIRIFLTFPQTSLFLSALLAFVSGVILSCYLKRKPQQRSALRSPSSAANLTHSDQRQDFTQTLTVSNSMPNRISTNENRESGVPLILRSRNSEHSSVLNDQNPPSYVEYMREISTEPNVIRWLPRLTDQTQTGTDSTDPVNEMFLQAVVNMQPRSGSTQSQEPQTTV